MGLPVARFGRLNSPALCPLFNIWRAGSDITSGVPCLHDLTRGKSCRTCLPVVLKARLRHDGRCVTAPAQAGAARLGARRLPSPACFPLALQAIGTLQRSTGPLARSVPRAVAAIFLPTSIYRRFGQMARPRLQRSLGFSCGAVPSDMIVA